MVSINCQCALGCVLLVSVLWPRSCPGAENEERIDQGAQREAHWSLIPPQRPALPDVGDPSWPQNPVDRFVLARLEREGLEPSPAAKKETLLRRVTLDLTGLPPTLAEIDAFLADDSPEAYERVVDRLLLSRRYGERMAVHWLDLARYADTHGYHVDSGRDMWIWRDWVIRAFNRNMPFDQFTIEQLAGDLLPDATIEQKIATGFNRNNMVNYEGGIIDEEFRVEYVADRVVTTSTVWLGLTMRCARCHDHKFDPLTMRDFYSFFAYFNNVPERGFDGVKGNAVPILTVIPPDRRESYNALVAEIEQLEPRLDHARPWPEIDAAQAEWENSYARAPGGATFKVLDPMEYSSSGGSTLTQLDDKSILVSGENPDKDVYEIVARTDEVGITGVLLEALTDESLPHTGPGRYDDNGDFVLSTFEVEVAPVDGSSDVQNVTFHEAEAGREHPNYEVMLALDDQVDTGWALGGLARFSPQPVSAKFYPAEPFGFEGGSEIRIRLRHESSWKQHGIGRFRLSLTTASAPKRALPADLARILALSPEQRDESQAKQLRQHYREQISTRYRKTQTSFAELVAERRKLTDGLPTTQVMEEMDQSRQAYVLERGRYDQHGEKVNPAPPAVLTPQRNGDPPNRLGLARWLVDPEQPLTARVTVNRFWQMMFGHGIVRTPEDFGVQGQRPTHPQLLDWLAVEFAEGGWDVQSLLKTIVMSSTYRQSSRATSEQRAKDPDNRLLARAPRIRLQAEFIRDSALAAGGLLVHEMGGPGIMPYQPAGLWREVAYLPDSGVYSAQVYQLSEGSNLHRRSVYTFWKRTVPPPNMQAFDAPDRESCIVRRNRSNSPLQALVLLNDPTYVEAARGVAQRVLREGGTSSSDRVELAFRTTVGRRPTPPETTTLTAALDEQLREFRGDPEAATRLLSIGQSSVAQHLDPVELAAYTTVCSIILNLDETITRE